MEKNRIVLCFALLYLSIVFPFLAFADSGDDNLIIFNNVYYRYDSIWRGQRGNPNFLESRAWGARPFRSATPIQGGSGRGYWQYRAIVVKGDYHGSVTIPNEIEINSQKYTVTGIENEAFKGSNIETISIPNLSYNIINNITFEGCTRLRSVDIPNLTNLREDAFSGCSNLRDVDLPKLTRIGDHAFSGCSALYSFTVRKTVTSIGERAFENCSNLQHLTVESGNNCFDSRDNCNAIIRKSDNKLIVGCSNSIIASTVEAIGDYAFSGCSQLKSFNISNPVKEIGKYAFYNCSNLESITIANSVKSIGEFAFGGCDLLKKVYSLIENPFTIDTSCFSSIAESKADLIVPQDKYAAYRSTKCWNEFAMIGSGGLMYRVLVIKMTAQGNGRLIYEGTEVKNNTEVTETGISPFGVVDLEFKIMPDNGYTLKELLADNVDVTNEVENGVYRIKDTDKGVELTAIFVEDKGQLYFTDAQSAKVCVDNWDANGDGGISKEEAALVTDIGNAFKNSTNLIAFDELQYFTALKSIPDNCFYNTGLTSVVLPENITEIGAKAFKNCNLETITIPAHVTKIGYEAFFDNWQRLTSVISKIRMPFDIDKQTFSNMQVHTGGGAIFDTGATIFTNATLYVPAGTKERYQKAEGWKYFQKIEEIVSDEPSLILESLTIEGDNKVNTSQTVTATIKNYGADFDGYICLYYKKDSEGNAIRNNTIHTSISSGTTRKLRYEFRPASSGTYQIWVALNYDANNIIDYSVTEEVLQTEKLIEFADEEVKRICVKEWDDDGDGELSETEAAAVSNLGDVFMGSNINSFEELKYFTGLTVVPKFAFYECNLLVKVALPSRIGIIEEGAFYQCRNLTSILLNEGLIELGDGAFCDCEVLTNFKMPNTLQKMGKFVFENCVSMTECEIPNGVTEIPYAAFVGCEKLENITLPSNVNKIDDYAFFFCSSLRSVHFSNSVNCIGVGAFAGCQSLNSIILPSSLEIIGEQAFAGCSDLSSLIIPSKVKEMGWGIVVACDNLKSLRVADNNPYYRSTGNGIISRSTNMLEQSCSTTTISNDIEGIADYGFIFVGGIEEIELPENIISIGYDSFQSCTDLKKVTLPKSLVSISDEAFLDCKKLEEVVVLNPVPVNIKDNVFYTNAYYEETGITDFTTAILYVPYGSIQEYQSAAGWKNFSKIIEIEPTSPLIAFPDTEVKRICVKNWDTNGDGEISEAEAANVQSLGYAFGLSSITTFDELRYFTGLTTIDEHAFDRCPNLQLVTIPSQVTSIGRAAFSACGELTTVNLPEGLTTIEEMSFERCSGLKSITIPSKVTSIGRAAFSACSSLTSITLPEGLKSIPELCFERCTGLKSINIPASVSNIGNNAFAQCNSLEEIVSDILDPYDIDASVFTNTTYASAKLIVPKGTQNKYRNALGWKNFSNIVESEPSDSPIIFADAEVKRICVENWDTNGDGELSEKEASVVIDLGCVFKGNSSIKQFDELRFFSSLESIGNNEFEGCYRLSSIVLPNAVKSIGAYAFSGCIFSTISIPSSVTEIHYSGLHNCSENIYVDTSNAYYSSLEGVLFSKDGKQLLTYPTRRSETSYIIPNIVSVIGECAFYISGLKSVIIPNGVVSIKRAAFRYCSSLESIILPSSLTTIESDNLEYCNKLTTITIPKSVTYLGSAVLSSCKNLQSIIVEDGNVNYSSIDGILYNKDKTKLQIYPAGKTEKEFVIPSHVTAIESYAFYGCQNLETITIHKDVTHIGRMAFMNCVELTSFTVKRAEPVSIGADVFGKDILSNGILYVPYGSKANYQVATGWKDFCNIIESEEEPAIITAKSYSREYGEPNPEFDFISEGAEIFGTPSISCTATKTSPVGSYDITISKGSIENGKVTYVKGTLKITKAPLTIKAGEYTKYQGSENPEFKPTYEGFKNGETEDVLSKMPIVTTTANEDSPLGEYDVFVTGAEAQNYEISYVAGTLIVEKLPKGDLDGKGYTDVSDVVATINHILGFRIVLTSEKEQIDMNDDGEINVGDVILLVKKILMQGNHFEIPTLARGDAETIDLTQYTAMQLTVNVPSGARIRDIRLAGDNNSSHSLMYQQTDDEHYTVVVYSMSNQKFKPVNGCLLEVDMEGNGEPMTADVLLATPSGERAFISTLPIGTSTGITEVSVNQLATGNVYDLRGNKVLDSGVSLKQLTNGVYIMNGKKIIR